MLWFIIFGIVLDIYYNWKGIWWIKELKGIVVIRIIFLLLKNCD